MTNSVEKFNELIRRRELTLESHCKSMDSSWAELCNYPEERDWYVREINPIDQEIIAITNSIIAYFSAPCKNSKTIHDVYSNDWLMQLVLPREKILYDKPKSR